MKWLLVVICGLFGCSNKTQNTNDVVDFSLLIESDNVMPQRPCFVPIYYGYDRLTLYASMNVDGAANWWNKTTGINLFMKSPDQVDLYMTTSQSMVPTPLQAFATFTEIDSVYKCVRFSYVVIVTPAENMSRPMWVMKHELGHILGLDDVDDVTHLMYSGADFAADDLAPEELKAIEYLYKGENF